MTDIELKIGYIGDGVTMPELTLGGHEVPLSGASIKYLGDNKRFVVLDDVMSAADIEVEIAKLLKATKPVSAKAEKPTDVIG